MYNPHYYIISAYNVFSSSKIRKLQKVRCSNLKDVLKLTDCHNNISCINLENLSTMIKKRKRVAIIFKYNSKFYIIKKNNNISISYSNSNIFTFNKDDELIKFMTNIFNIDCSIYFECIIFDRKFNIVHGDNIKRVMFNYRLQRNIDSIFNL